MPPAFSRTSNVREYCVTPDEIDAWAAELKAAKHEGLRIDEFRQFDGRAVYALTVGAASASAKKLLVTRPHAHEPAGTAACTELIMELLGIGAGSRQNAAWRAWTRQHFLITFVPDANPSGSQRAPVKFWDGSKFSNDEFFLWMFGESGERKGERFPRVDSWDLRSVARPARIGIAYEKIDAHAYVEPNRDYRSTFFRSFFELDRRYGYDAWIDLHQTEFVDSPLNTAVFLPTCHDQLSAGMRQRHEALAAAIHARFNREGARPGAGLVVPYRDNPEQAALLNKVWKPICERLVHIVTEVQNNNPATPAAEQVWLQMAAVLAGMEWMSLENPC